MKDSELREQGPNELSILQRREMRARQDQFLAFPDVKKFISVHGIGWPIRGYEGPSFRELAADIFPNEQEWLQQCVDHRESEDIAVRQCNADNENER